MKVQHMIKHKLSLLLVLCSFMGMNVFAAEDPTQMLRKVTNDVMEQLKLNREEYRRDSSKLYEMVNRLIVPHADFVEMSRWVVGRTAWNQADEKTRRAFATELEKLVVRTYARSLLNFTNQEIVILPYRGSLGGKNRVEVSSQIRQKGRSPINVNYYLTQSGGGWKVYDIIIEKVSLMQGYRSQFSDAVNRGGVAAALEKLRGHNNKGARR